LGEIDNLLQTVMFTLYGNQYDDEEEHLLLSMFQRVLKEEFDESNSVSNLLRANTALTRMMTTYTRRGPGQSYLKTALTTVLTKITSDSDVCLEINPLKVYETYVNDYESKNGKQCPLPKKVTAEEAALQPIIKDIIKPRLKQLHELATSFINSIIASIDTVPYGIRWICKQIRDLSKEKFPTATREQVCSLIGGFFLLRFINPAVVTPQAFMLVDTKLSANTRRNLTLLAKIMQNLANNTQFGGVKEFYMAPLNEFLNNCREPLNKFLEDLTRVDNLDDHLQLDKYLRLGKTSEVFINITLNEMYFIHSLLIEHVNTLQEKSGDSSLREILNELGPAPPQLPRKDNANVELLLLPRYQGNESTDVKEMKHEQLYTETKYLLFTIIKAIPSLSAESEANIKIVLQTAQKVLY
jgi:Ras GTPase-activating-like protein IQGAP2/3